MKFTVYFKPNTEYNHGAKLIVNVPLIRRWSKSIAIRTTNRDNGKVIDKIEIFIPSRLVSEVPPFFIGELRMLSSQIQSVSRV